MLLQANEEIGHEFDLADLHQELDHIETDEDLKATEDRIELEVDPDLFL